MNQARVITCIAICSFLICAVSRATEDRPPPPESAAAPSGLFYGGMGGPIFKIHNLGDGFIYGIGGRGAMSIMSMFLLGGGGYGSIGQTHIEIDGKEEQVSLGYGGLGVGFKIFPSAFIHISSFNMASVGRIALSGRNESSHCFVLEPELNAEFTLISFIRLGLGATFRYIIAKNLSVSSKDLWGFGGQAYIEFGWM